MSFGHLAKATLIGALAVNAAACDNSDQNETDCRIVMNEADVEPLYSKQAVTEYCAANTDDPNKVQSSTGSQVLSCIESVDENGNVVTVDLNCNNSGLGGALDEVYANNGAYCVPGGVTLYCDGAVPPEGSGESCEIVPDSDADFSTLTETSDVLNHCQNNTDSTQENLTCVGLTTDGMDLVKLKTTCSDPNLESKLNGVLQNSDPNNKGCITTDADIVCE